MCETETQRERERERECVCVYERERERERETARHQMPALNKSMKRKVKKNLLRLFDSKMTHQKFLDSKN